MPTPWTEHVESVAKDFAGARTYPLVEIVWRDAAAYGVEWTDTIENDVRISLAVGYLVAESDDAVSVVALMNIHQVGAGIVIPKEMIVSWRDIGVI